MNNPARSTILAVLFAGALVPSIAAGDGPAPSNAPKVVLAPKTPVRVVTAPALTLSPASTTLVKDALQQATTAYAIDKKPSTLKQGGASLKAEAARAYRVKAARILAPVGRVQAVGVAVPAPRFEAKLSVESGEIVYFTSINCEVQVQIDFTVKNTGSAVPAGGPAPTLEAFDTWTWASYSAPVPRLASGASATVRVGPMSISVGANGAGGCRTLDQHYDLHFMGARAAASYDLTVSSGGVTLEAAPSSDGGALGGFGYECPNGECSTGKCILPNVGCNY